MGITHSLYHHPNVTILVSHRERVFLFFFFPLNRGIIVFTCLFMVRALFPPFFPCGA